MAKKLNKDELNNVSGGCGGDNGNTSEDPYANCSYVYNCNNEGCKKSFKYTDAILKDNKIYCPYCKKYVCDDHELG